MSHKQRRINLKVIGHGKEQFPAPEPFEKTRTNFIRPADKRTFNNYAQILFQSNNPTTKLKRTTVIFDAYADIDYTPSLFWGVSFLPEQAMT